MDVRSILELKGTFVLTVPVDASISDAARVLAENHVGAVVVADSRDEVVGILSERDIAIALPRLAADLGDARVSDLMSAPVLTCSESNTVTEVLDVMVTNGIRHLPVVSDGRLAGVISLRDVVGNWLGIIAESLDSDGDADQGPLEPSEVPGGSHRVA